MPRQRSAPRLTNIRAKLARRNLCDDNCKGWDVFETGTRGFQLQRCDSCFHGVSDPLTDAEVKKIPAARKALAAIKAKY